MTDAPVWIVTGASSGIGRALALRAARAGCRVVANARRAERLDELAAQIRAAGGTCVVVAGDVRDEALPQRLVQTALDAFGRIDVVANVAGMGAPGPLLEQSDAAIDAQWRVHVVAPLRLARTALPSLRASHGVLVFVGSGLARVPMPGFGAYPAVKAAIRAAATQLRRELRGDGVAVTYVDPGIVATEFSEAAQMEQRMPRPFVANADVVAARILRGVRARAGRVNAVPYHTFGAMLGEWFPALADRVAGRITAVPMAGPPAPAAAPPAGDASPAGDAVRASSEFERALEPVARRMERVKLLPAFLRELLVPGTQFSLNDAAMRWAGMPNKNERAALHEALDALTAARFLESAGNERWHVLRTAD